MLSWPRFPSVVLLAVLLAAVLAAVAGGPANAATSPSAGSPNHGQTLCAPNAFTWTRTGAYTGVNDYGPYTCVNSTAKAVLRITARPQQPGGQGGFPNLSSGYNLNNDGCPSVNARALGECFRYDIPLGQQGNPVSSYTGYTGPGFAGNTAWDIWFTHFADKPWYSQRCSTDPAAADTEIMIWPQSVDDLSGGPYPVRIDGQQWRVLTWDTDGSCPHGQSWRLVIFQRDNHRNGAASATVSLDPFFSYAFSQGWLTRRDLLVSIHFGWEILAGGRRNAVYRYALTGLPRTHR